MKISYARDSTKEQNLDRQIDVLYEFGRFLRTLQVALEISFSYAS